MEVDLFNGELSGMVAKETWMDSLPEASSYFPHIAAAISPNFPSTKHMLDCANGTLRGYDLRLM
jgi:hypothetical protein